MPANTTVQGSKAATITADPVQLFAGNNLRIALLLTNDSTTDFAFLTIHNSIATEVDLVVIPPAHYVDLYTKDIGTSLQGEIWVQSNDATAVVWGTQILQVP